MNIKRGIASVTALDFWIRAVLACLFAVGYAWVGSVTAATAAFTWGVAFLFSLAFLAGARALKF